MALGGTLSLSIRRLVQALRRGPHAPVLALCLAAGVAIAAIVVGVLWPSAWGPMGTIAAAAAVALLIVNTVMLGRLRARLNDVHDAVALENGLRRAQWHLTDFFYDGAAATASLQLIHFKVLRFTKPRRILELGSGQTTKVLSAYARENPGTYVLTLEQDREWAARLKDEMAHDYRHVPLETMEVALPGESRKVTTRWYSDVQDLHGAPFDYILVDGPDTGIECAEAGYLGRAGILNYLPRLLAPSFVLIFDDAERLGEAGTIEQVAKVLEHQSVSFRRFDIYGVKTQTVFCSPNFTFLAST